MALITKAGVLLANRLTLFVIDLLVEIEYDWWDVGELLHMVIYHYHDEDGPMPLSERICTLNTLLMVLCSMLDATDPLLTLPACL